MAMDELAALALVAGLLATGLAFAGYLVYAVSGVRADRLAAADDPADAARDSLRGGPRRQAAGRFASLLLLVAIGFISVSLVSRTVAAGHGPFANMYEFSVAFAWGVLVAEAWFEHRFRQRLLGLVALPVALGLMAYALAIPSAIEPLVPALQNSLLLTVHVAVAIVAYGSFTIGFAAAVLHLAQPAEGRWGLPRPAVLDEVAYRSIVVGFPFLTLTIVLGALWADVAWGRYWAWDPKETASLVTWLIYGAYLHARRVRGWQGRRAAVLLLVGFVATLFTFFGVNLFLPGLHSYAGL
jgi:ABC-type transport system involved in cytochrome c biogenesis permease subunit